MSWQMLVLKLRRHGHSDIKVGQAIGKSRHWVMNLANEKQTEVTWSDGWNLLEYASQHLPRDVLEELR